MNSAKSRTVHNNCDFMLLYIKGFVEDAAPEFVEAGCNGCGRPQLAEFDGAEDPKAGCW